MNAHTTLIHAYDSLARHCHRWPAKARALAMADLWRLSQQIKQEENDALRNKAGGKIR